MQRAKPYAESNLTGLGQLAAAAYLSHATEPVPWEQLPPEEVERWISIVSFVAGIVLPRFANDAGPDMDRVRGDSINAAAVARRQFERAFELIGPTHS